MTEKLLTMLKITILSLIVSMMGHANDFFSDDIPSKQGNSTDIFNDKATGFDAEGELESVKRYHLKQKLEKKKKQEVAYNKEMDSMCGCYFKLCLSSVNYNDPIYVQQRWNSTSKCEDSYRSGKRYARGLKGKAKRRRMRDLREERDDCKSYVRKRQKRKDLCYKWKSDQNKGIDSGSKYATEIKELQGEIRSQLAKEEAAKKERHRRDKFEDQLEIDKAKRAEQMKTEAKKRKQDEALEARYQRCVKLWADKRNPCGCGVFKNKPIPEWVRNAKACSK
jgi:hypothetical protein